MELSEKKELFHNQYDDEPVYYCKNCLSLRIMTLNDFEFCDKCSTADIGVTTIDEWEKMYENKYKHKFINE